MGSAGILGTKLFKLGGKWKYFVGNIVLQENKALYYSVPRPKKYSILDFALFLLLQSKKCNKNFTNYLLCANKKLENLRDKTFYLTLSLPISVLGHQRLFTLNLRLGPDCLSSPESGWGELSFFWPRSLLPLYKPFCISGVGGRMHSNLLLSWSHLGRDDHPCQLQQVQEQRVPRRHHGRLWQLHDELLCRLCHLWDHWIHGSWAWGTCWRGRSPRWEQNMKRSKMCKGQCKVGEMVRNLQIVQPVSKAID